MRHPTTAGIALIGGGIIAITYGLARFVFGLFLPEIRSDLGLSATAAGLVGAVPFVTFAAAIMAGPAASRYLKPRRAAALAAGLASLGLATIAVSPGPLVLGLGVAACGISTGLASPVMAQSVHEAVPRLMRGRVNAIHNAGTSLGVALGMPAAVFFLGAWRPAYTVFAAIAAAAAIAAFLYLPARHSTRPPPRTGTPLPAISRKQAHAIARLCALAGTMGLVSSVFWVFAPDLVVRHGGLSPEQSGWMWLAVGLAGLAGASAGDLIDRLGAGRTHALALALMGLSLLLVVAWPGTLALAMVSAAAFGAAYMTLTGFHLVRSVRTIADRPALGPVMPLLATAIGQAVGSPLAGGIIDTYGYGGAFGGFAALAIAVAASTRRMAAD